jgi:hypothetical protein
MAYVDVTVEVDLSDFDNEVLIEELEGRGWYVGEEKGWVPNEELTDDEINHILEMFSWRMPGTLGHSIYEKLRKR